MWIYVFALLLGLIFVCFTDGTAILPFKKLEKSIKEGSFRVPV